MSTCVMYIMCVILIKTGFFKVTPKSGQTPCTIVQGLWPNFIKND